MAQSTVHTAGATTSCVDVTTCRYAYIAEPWTEFARIYDDAYYAGMGADPLVDYQFELEEPDATIRVYEWRGIVRLVETLLGGLDGIRWLDFGAGNGGLVAVRITSHHSLSGGLRRGGDRWSGA